ncbi:uncharacterized protein LJ206_014612 isoform 1-T1 [Theristicus caerulescens]
MGHSRRQSSHSLKPGPNGKEIYAWPHLQSAESSCWLHSREKASEAFWWCFYSTFPNHVEKSCCRCVCACLRGRESKWLGKEETEQDFKAGKTAISERAVWLTSPYSAQLYNDPPFAPLSSFRLKQRIQRKQKLSSPIPCRHMVTNSQSLHTGLRGSKSNRTTSKAAQES